MTLRLTALQLPARFDATNEQLAFAQLLLEAGPRTDLVLLPEASLTGYVSEDGDFDLTDLAEPVDGPTRAALAHLAKRFDCLVVGPLIERADTGLYNSVIGLTPEGATLLHYRKHHPWFPEKWATPGQTHGEVVSWRGKKLVPAICFDVHFLSEDAGAELNEADLLLFASAWVDEEPPPSPPRGRGSGRGLEPLSDSRPPLLQEIATRHSIAVLDANWGPGRPRVHGQGGSLFIDTEGQLQSRMKTDTGRLDITLP